MNITTLYYFYKFVMKSQQTAMILQYIIVEIEIGSGATYKLIIIVSTNFE